MKLHLAVLGFIFISQVAHAEKLSDVTVLEAKPGADNIELRLQVKGSKADSYFKLDITKDDPEAFTKLVKVVKKMKDKDKFKLDLNIPSFSETPSGSYYPSKGITFDLRGEDRSKPAKKAQ